MQKSFIGKRIVVFTAHPDDEGIVAGTMYQNHEAGGETFLICATYGEKGKSHLKKPLTDAALARMRKAELLKAAKILKIDKVIFLGLPDASVRENAKKLYEKSLPIIQKIKPDYILSFGSDGLSAHWDHITVGKVGLRIAKKLKIPLMAFTISPEFRQQRRPEMFIKRRAFGKYAGVPEHRPHDLKIKIDLAIKRKAMVSHVSQFGTGDFMRQMPAAVIQKMFGYEYFVEEKL